MQTCKNVFMATLQKHPLLPDTAPLRYGSSLARSLLPSAVRFSSKMENRNAFIREAMEPRSQDCKMGSAKVTEAVQNVCWKRRQLPTSASLSCAIFLQIKRTSLLFAVFAFISGRKCVHTQPLHTLSPDALLPMTLCHRCRRITVT